MSSQNQKHKAFLSGVLMQVVYGYKKHLAIIGIAAIILSAIFSGPYFITPLFESEVILYPTASNSISKVLLSNNFNNSKDILEFGEIEQTEHMLQVLNSNKIRDRIIIKYNLLNHYNIKPGSKFRMTRLYEEYESNFRFRRTEYMAVKITVFDKDPLFAANMANDVADLVDSTINHMQKKIAKKAFKIVAIEYNKLKSEIKFKEDSLTVLREFGVHDYESQSEMFNRQLAIEMARGDNKSIERLEKKLKTLSKYGGPYVSLRDALEHDKKQLSQLKAKYEEAKVDATESLPHTFVINTAYEAEKKTYPIRWLIVLITTMASLFLAVTLFSVIDLFSGKLGEDIKKKSSDLRLTTKKRSFLLNKNTSSPVDKVIQEEKVEIEKNAVNLQRLPANEETEYYIWDINNIDMDKIFNSAHLINLIGKWRYQLLALVIISAVLAGIFSGPTFITPLYDSHAIVYPANVEPYSDESETEQMLQMLSSQDIVDSMVKKFNLSKHYDINPEYKYFKTALYDSYHDHVSISKTPYESVRIEVSDHNPDTAALMVSALLEFYNIKIAQLHKSKSLEVIAMYKMQLMKKRMGLDSLKHILYKLGTEEGLIEYGYQSQEIMRGYLGTVNGNNNSQINKKEVNRLLRNMEKGSGQLIEVVQMIQDEARSYVEVKLDYEMAIRFYDSNLTYSNIVSYPYPSDKKSYPIRWLIVALFSLGTFIMALLLIFFVENKKKQPTV